MQYVHNLLIAMPGSKLTVASTCTYHCSSKHVSDGNENENENTVVGGQHYGISEFYVEKDAELCFSMVGKDHHQNIRFGTSFLHYHYHHYHHYHHSLVRFTHGVIHTWYYPVQEPLSRKMAYSTATTSV